MRVRQHLREVAIAFVGHDDRRSCLGDEQIGAGNADIGADEFVAQHRTSLGDQVLRRIELARLWQRVVGPAEVRRDLFLVEVNDGGDDVARPLAPQLHDILAKISLDHGDAGALKLDVEPDFLRHHGFALGDELGSCLAAERKTMAQASAAVAA